MSTLYFHSEDYCTLKIQLLVALLGLEVAVEKGTSVEQLKKLDFSAKSVLLQTPGGNLTQHLSILRYLAQSKENSGLFGLAPLDRAQIDQWLEFSWHELGKF